MMLEKPMMALRRSPEGGALPAMNIYHRFTNLSLHEIKNKRQWTGFESREALCAYQGHPAHV